MKDKYRTYVQQISNNSTAATHSIKNADLMFRASIMELLNEENCIFDPINPRLNITKYLLAKSLTALTIIILEDRTWINGTVDVLKSHTVNTNELFNINNSLVDSVVKNSYLSDVLLLTTTFKELIHSLNFNISDLFKLSIGILALEIYKSEKIIKGVNYSKNWRGESDDTVLTRIVENYGDVTVTNILKSIDSVNITGIK